MLVHADPSARMWSPPGLLGIIVNLMLLSGYYDLALRDFGPMLGASALGRFGQAYAP